MLANIGLTRVQVPHPRPLSPRGRGEHGVDSHCCCRPLQFGHSAGGDVAFPLFKEGPTDGTGAEVGEGLVADQAVDGFLNHGFVLHEGRAVTGKEDVRIIITNAFQAGDKVGQIGTVVGIDHADTTIAVEVVATEKDVACFERELPFGVAGRVPDGEFDIADLEDVAFFDQLIDLAGGHIESNTLSADVGEGLNHITLLDEWCSQGVGNDLGTGQQFLSTGQALYVVSVGMGGDEVLAIGELVIESTNQFDGIVDGVQVAHVNQGEGGATINEVNIHTKLAAGLVVQFDDFWMSEEVLAFEHRVRIRNSR